MKILYVAFVMISIASKRGGKIGNGWGNSKRGNGWGNGKSAWGEHTYSAYENSASENNGNTRGNGRGNNKRRVSFGENKIYEFQKYAVENDGNSALENKSEQNRQKIYAAIDKWESPEKGTPIKEAPNVLYPQNEGNHSKKQTNKEEPNVLHPQNIPEGKKTVYIKGSGLEIPEFFVPQNKENYLTLSLDDFVKYFEIGGVRDELELWPKCGVLVVLEKDTNGEGYNWTKCLWDTKKLEKWNEDHNRFANNWKKSFSESEIDLLIPKIDYIKEFRNSRESIAINGPLEGRKQIFDVKYAYDALECDQVEYLRNKIVALLSKKEPNWKEVFEWIIESKSLDYANKKNFIASLMTNIVNEYGSTEKLGVDIGSKSPAFLENNKPEVLQQYWSLGLNKKKDIDRPLKRSIFATPCMSNGLCDPSSVQPDDILCKPEQRNEFVPGSEDISYTNAGNNQQQENSHEAFINSQLKQMIYLQNLEEEYKKMLHEEMCKDPFQQKTSTYRYYEGKIQQFQEDLQKLKKECPEAYEKLNYKY